MKTTFRIFICIALVFILTGKLFAQVNVTTENGGNTNYVPKFSSTYAISQGTIYDNGNIGIGSASPSGKLHVIATGVKSANYSGTILSNVAVSTYSSVTKSCLELSSTGIWAGTSSKNIGLYISSVSSASNNIGIYVSSVSGGTTNYDAIFNGGGNVGIGTTSPSAKLDVKGTLRLSGSTSGYVGFSPAAAAGSTIYTLPSADGDSGQFLHTDGEGALSWQTPTTSATAWQLTGNAGAYHVLGTTDNNSFSLITNNQQRIAIGADGLVHMAPNYGDKVTIGEGNGIYNATAILQVGGDVLFYKPGYGITEAPCIRGGYTYSTPSKPDYSWYYDDSTGIFHPVHDAIAFSGGGTEAMRIAKKYIGIGTTTPNALLHVNIQDTTELGTVASKFSYGIYGNDNVFIVPKLDNNSFDSLSLSGDKGIFWSDGSVGDSTAGLVIAPYCNKYNGLRITAEGNVGIGTPLIYNPRNYKLAVNGFIGAKEIYVENTSTTWPDYVFSNDYNLPSLNDVEKFVNQNKHLPDVPSAAEVAEKGQAIGEMNAVLLKKVEELTLYIIEQNKTINEQQKAIQELKEKSERMELKLNHQ